MQTAPHMLQLCRPLSGAVSWRATEPDGTGHVGFNCAAPFRGRVVGPPVAPTSPPLRCWLQLCRPLSGAVRRCRAWQFPAAYPRFNCAAPFRGRLDPRRQARIPGASELQLCRPLSGAVSRVSGLAYTTPLSCFNCAAPFRGRLEGQAAYAAEYAGIASIVPPPFGGG